MEYIVLTHISKGSHGIVAGQEVGSLLLHPHWKQREGTGGGLRWQTTAQVYTFFIKAVIPESSMYSSDQLGTNCSNM